MRKLFILFHIFQIFHGQFRGNGYGIYRHRRHKFRQTFLDSYYEYPISRLRNAIFLCMIKPITDIVAKCIEIWHNLFKRASVFLKKQSSYIFSNKNLGSNFFNSLNNIYIQTASFAIDSQHFSVDRNILTRKSSNDDIGFVWKMVDCLTNIAFHYMRTDILFIVPKLIHKCDTVKFAEHRTLGWGAPEGSPRVHERVILAQLRRPYTRTFLRFCTLTFASFYTPTFLVCRAYRPILLFDKANSLAFSITKPLFNG